MIDNNLTTLHIRCASDICDTLRQAGFTGDFLEYADPVHDGPLPAGNLIQARARMLATSFGGSLGLTESAYLTGLLDAEQRLTEAHARYQRVVLWFEHDHYDQLILARCLSGWRKDRCPR